MRATNIKATRGAVATKAVAVGRRACAHELYTMKQCCLGSGDCCLYSTRAHTRNKNHNVCKTVCLSEELRYTIRAMIIIVYGLI
jgi:hypothetical protein